MENKLLELQKRVGKVVKGEYNPFYKSKYADINAYLDVVMPLASEIGLTILQPLKVKDGQNVLTTIVVDGNNTLASSEVILPNVQDPQKMGSAITYFRRYSLQSLLSLQAEDDDGNSVTGVSKQNTVKQNTTQPKIEPLRFGKPIQQKKCACGNVIKGNYDKCWSCNEADKKRRATGQGEMVNTAPPIGDIDVPF